MGRRAALTPLSISDSLCCIARQVIVEVVEYLILLVNGVEEAAEELDAFSLIPEEFNDLAAIVEVWCRDKAGEVGRCLEADVRLEADEICEEFVDLSDPIASIECGDGEGGGREGGDGGLGLDDDVEGGGHGKAVIVVAGKASDWCRTGFWVV